MKEINVEELTAIPEIDLPTVKERAVKGIVTLIGRTGILQIISFFGFLVLTIFLNQAEIGLFFAVSELVAILGYFSDIGLAASLIQKKEKPSLREIRSTFTLQQLLVITLVGLMVVFTPWLKNFYHISSEGVWLLRSLIFGFFLASLKTIPSVLLERQLKFEFLVLVEIVETLTFYLVAGFLAWRGFGVLSYAWAVLLRGIFGVVLIYFLFPWRVGFAFDWRSLGGLLKFGVPYQGNTLLAVVKDRLMNVFLWKIVGAGGMGILGWAQKWAQMPLRFFMDPVMKVTFPAYSRMQTNQKELQRAVEKTLFYVSLLTFPVLIGMVILIKPLIFLIPKYQKWEVAVLAFIFYVINSAWAAVTTPLTNVLAATGRIKIVFKLMIMWTMLTWIFYPLLGIKFGYNGIALASALVSFSSLLAILITKRQINFSFWKSINQSFLSSLLMGGVIYVLTQFLGRSFWGIFLLVIAGGLFYFSLIFLMRGEKFLEELKNIYFFFRK